MCATMLRLGEVLNYADAQCTSVVIGGVARFAHAPQSCRQADCLSNT
jgi:hypothetical protein